jgi:hypothetical protein
MLFYNHRQLPTYCLARAPVFFLTYTHTFERDWWHLNSPSSSLRPLAFLPPLAPRVTAPSPGLAQFRCQWQNCCRLPQTQHLHSPSSENGSAVSWSPLSSPNDDRKSQRFVGSESQEPLVFTCVRSSHLLFCLTNLYSEWKVLKRNHRKEIIVRNKL